MNIQEVIFVSSMAVIIGLAIFVLGMFPSKNKVLCVIGISIMAIAMANRWNSIKFCNSNSTARNTSTGLISKG